ncbi:MAG: ParB N-terminal domain-containing protein [bacterium]
MSLEKSKQTLKEKDCELLEIDELSAHEEINRGRLKEIIDQMRRENLVDYPILVENEHNVILDGHHRYFALKEMGADFVPVDRVDYFKNGLVKLEPRPNCPLDNLTKQDVLQMGKSDDVFPPKSTRHILTRPEKIVNITLDCLFG